MGNNCSGNKPEERKVTKASFNPYKYDIAVSEGQAIVKNKKSGKVSYLKPLNSSTSPSTCLFLEKSDDDEKYDRKKNACFLLVSHQEDYSLYEPVYNVKYEKKNQVELTLANNEKRIIPENEFVKFSYKNQPLSELKNGEYDILTRDGADYHKPGMSVWQRGYLVFEEHGAVCDKKFFSYYMTIFALPGTFTKK